ncbi:MAG: hypothetical protein AB3N18_05765 [Allomuricauda sp.]
MKEHLQSKLDKYEQIGLNAFGERLADSYGSPEELATILDLGIEMLFYVEENTFDRRKVQNVVSALKDIIGLLRQE